MILAVDTSIGTSVALVALDGRVLAERASDDPRGHAESIGPLLAAVLGMPGALERVSAVAVGMGPGPFTGLRVGIAAARAFAAGRGVPVWPVLSHDAVAADVETARAFAVVTDAKRREHYVTRYTATVGGIPQRTLGSELVRLDEAPLDLEVVRPPSVSAASLGVLALRLRAAGLPTGPEGPQYLREPDVTPAAAPKRVS